MSRKVINVVVNGSSNDNTTLTLKIEGENVSPTITEENFESFFGITFEQYILIRENIRNFQTQLKVYNEGSLLYDTWFLGAFIQKANMPDGSYNDYYIASPNELGTGTLNIETNSDKSFKSCTISGIEL